MATVDPIHALIDKLIAECGGNNAAAKKLGVSGPYLVQVRQSSRTGGGGKIQAALMRLYPKEMAEILRVRPPVAKSEAKEQDLAPLPHPPPQLEGNARAKAIVDAYEQMERAIAAYRTVNPSADLRTVRMAAGAVLLQYHPGQPVPPTWWITRIAQYVEAPGQGLAALPPIEL